MCKVFPTFSASNFYPRSPCGERQENMVISMEMDKNFYPRSPCGERPLFNLFWLLCHTISIHALLAESDISFMPVRCTIWNFYPRSPCGERRPARVTPTASRNFYPRSPCGERRWSSPQATVSTWQFLSTLSLRRATVVDTVKFASSMLFLSTLSLRRATPLF